MAELRDWLMNHPGAYGIDAYYQDMYGYNVSKSWNSILKKTGVKNSSAYSKKGLHHATTHKI